MNDTPVGLYILSPDAYEKVYAPGANALLAPHIMFAAPPQTAASVAANPTILQNVEVIFSGWGAPLLSPDFLRAAPNLRAFFYGAGATGGLLSPQVWERGITVTSAAQTNAIPVAEFTFAAVVFCLKNALRFMRTAHTTGKMLPASGMVPGAFQTTVGLISLGAIGRLVLERLRSLEVSVIVYDPFLPSDDARALGVESVTLSELFRRADVVSLHAPWLPETEGMITGRHFAAMKPNAAFINTARGAVVRESEMSAALAARPDLSALLDVTYPGEPPAPDSPLWILPNVFLTPHIAGSIGGECARMGDFMAEEYFRWQRGEPLLGAIHPEAAQNTSHRVPPAKGATP